MPAGQPSLRRPQARVLLLEAGGKDNYHWIHIPVGYLYLMGNPRTDWGFKTAAEPGLNGRSLAYPRGRVLGGCSSINGMIYMRGQARDYDLWRQMGNPGWAWDDVLPYFKQHEDQWALEPEAFDDLHARGGEWRVEQPRIQLGHSGRVPRGGSRSRHPEGRGLQSRRQRGLRLLPRQPEDGRALEHVEGLSAPRAPPPQSRRRDRRHGRAAGARRQARDRPRHAPARQPAHDPRRAKAWFWQRAPSARRRSCSFRVSAPASVLQPFGIEVRHDLRGVGENLQDHLQVRCAYKVQGVKTMNERFQSLAQRAGFAAQYVLKRRGPMTMAPSQLGAFVQIRPEPRDAQPAVSCAAADPAEVRRTARPVPGLYGQRCQCSPDQPRLGAHHRARPGSASRDPPQLPRRPRTTGAWRPMRFA